MSSKDQAADFARAIEDDFLPSMIKPGRYASLEWVSPKESLSNSATSSAAATSGPAVPELPLAVVVGLRNYERSVNDPLTVATRLALLDSGKFRVGTTYLFGPEALTRLAELELAPFSSPEFTALSKASVLLTPFHDWSELGLLAEILKAARIPLSKEERNDLDSSDNGAAKDYPRIIALTDSDTPALANKIFDSVINLSEFLSCPALALDDSIEVEPRTSVSTLLPNRQIIPQIEISQQKARFKFHAPADTTTSDSEQICSLLVNGVKLSGLTEIAIEDCARAIGAFGANDSAELGKIIDKLTHQIDAKRFSFLLRELNPQQVTPLLAGALNRFRRVRVELSVPSLSPSALKTNQVQRVFDIKQLAERLALLQIEPLQSLHLQIELGYPTDESLEIQETCETLRACADALRSLRGFRVKFRRLLSPFAPIIDDSKIQHLFENIKRGSRFKGVTYALDDSPAAIFGALITRNAFGAVSELESFLERSQTVDVTSDNQYSIWSEFAEVFASSLELPFEYNQELNAVASDCSALESLARPTANTISPFGRRKKRTVISTVSAPTKTRLRFVWSVTGPARFLSHLDNIRAIESALLRSEIPLTYTQGQRPRLKISFGAPKPVGFTSDCEMFDAFFETSSSGADVSGLDAFLPPGYRIVSTSKSLTKELSILESLQNATYLIGVPSENVDEKLSVTLAKNRLPYVRRKKNKEREVDLRAGIFAAEIIESSASDYHRFFDCCATEYHKTGGGAGSMQILRLTLALTDTYYVRPEEFLDVAGIFTREESTKAKIHRLHFGFERLSPLATPRAQAASVAN